MFQTNHLNSTDDEDDDGGDDQYCEIISSDDENELKELRENAILSMIKTEEEETILSDENEISVITVDKIEQKDEIIKKIDFSTFKVNQKSINIDFLIKQKRPQTEQFNTENKRQKLSKLENLVENSSLVEENLLKEAELKKKLFAIYKAKNMVKQSIKINSPMKLMEKSISSAILSNFDQKNTPKMSQSELLILNRYNNNIIDNERSIGEITKSINGLMSSIKEKLKKSKSIAIEIENLKRAKIDIHKEVSVTRSKILYLNRVKKQRAAAVGKYRLLRDRYIELSTKSSSSLNIENNLETRSPEHLDSNQIICPFWINNNSCIKKHCVYQHPKIIITSKQPITTTATATTKSAPIIKENDKVFLPQMNPQEFITSFHCVPCSSRILLSSLHIFDDWHCKSCCERIMIITKPTEIIDQLIIIWHHIYKRWQITQTRNIPSSIELEETVLNSLLKCTNALKAKLIALSSVPLTPLIKTASCHVLLTFSETKHSIDDLIHFLDTMNQDIDLVLFAITLSIPVPIAHRLIIDVINKQINRTSFDRIDLLIDKYCLWSAYIVDKNILKQLFHWLNTVVEADNNCNNVIDSLTRSILNELMNGRFQDCLNYTFNNDDIEDDDDDSCWIDRKEFIGLLLKLYKCNGDTKSILYMIINKYWILSLFHTGNEERAIETCQQFSQYNFYFNILLSKLSLKLNNQIIIEDKCDIVTFFEHNFNKSQWLLLNRSEKSCLKVLENVVGKLYRVEHEDGVIDSLDCYEHFLGLERKFDRVLSNLVIKLSKSEADAIRQTSSIWLCYVSLSALRRKEDNNDELWSFIDSDVLLSLSSNHLTRIIQFIFRNFSNIYKNNNVYYNDRIKSTFLKIEKYIDFQQFIDLIKVISFRQLNQCQLSIWLFLIDFFHANYHNDDRKRWKFFTEMSSTLSESCSITNPDNYDIFCHIVLCYSIDIEKVWLHLIELNLKLNFPLYTLIDICEMAIGNVGRSQSLWRHYYSAAVKLKDALLIESVKESASKVGFILEGGAAAVKE